MIAFHLHLDVGFQTPNGDKQIFDSYTLNKNASVSDLLKDCSDCNFAELYLVEETTNKVWGEICQFAKSGPSWSVV